VDRGRVASCARSGTHLDQRVDGPPARGVRDGAGPR
jgi:hypothetical protein